MQKKIIPAYEKIIGNRNYPSFKGILECSKLGTFTVHDMNDEIYREPIFIDKKTSTFFSLIYKAMGLHQG